MKLGFGFQVMGGQRRHGEKQERERIETIGYLEETI
jgi:hypothetical protein